MKIADFYGWGLPKQNDFLNHFKNNDMSYHQAQELWSKLDSSTVLFLITFIVLTVVIAIIYYGPYNNKPNRHYKVNHWFIFMVITTIATFVMSLGAGFLTVQSPLPARIGLIFRISGINAIYSIGLYFFIALLVCNIPFLKTNAYKFLKIRK